VPGVWRTKGERAWVTSWLLHPEALRARGLRAPIVAHRYELDDLPKGGSALRLLRLPLARPGVLAVIPRVFDDAIEVMGREGTFDVEALGAAFREAGADVSEEK
jgi:hypothetical protein